MFACMHDSEGEELALTKNNGCLSYILQPTVQKPES